MSGLYQQEQSAKEEVKLLETWIGWCVLNLWSPGLVGVPTDRSGGSHNEINDCVVTGRGHWHNLGGHVPVWPGHQGSALWSSVTVVAPSKGDRKYFIVSLLQYSGRLCIETTGCLWRFLINIECNCKIKNLILTFFFIFTANIKEYYMM